MWHLVSDLQQSADDEISAQVEIKSDSPWFSGHFPGDPILPGIAQLGMVAEVIERACCRQLKVEGISRVRFRRIIRPGETIRLSANPMTNKPGTYSFRITAVAETVCNGFMHIKEVQNGS